MGVTFLETERHARALQAITICRWPSKHAALEQKTLKTMRPIHDVLVRNDD